MTAKKDTSTRDAGKAGGWVHFGLAAGLLALSTVGFQYAISVLKLATQKQPVPWPEGVVVDSETFRWQNMPTEFGGRYVLAEDGELEQPTDGKPDGERTVRDDVMKTLGIGTSWDEVRLDGRSSNWLSIRIYRDNTKPPNHPLRYWQLEVYYYTGALDTVPHTPERCLAASGASLLSSDNVTVSVPLATKPWNEPFALRRALYERQGELGMGAKQYVQYYMFSLNGKPESSWETVRLTLAAPWVRYCYFAKIQFYPHASIADVEEVDGAAREFMNHFLPAVLQALPMPGDIGALGSEGKSTD